MLIRLYKHTKLQVIQSIIYLSYVINCHNIQCGNFILFSKLLCQFIEYEYGTLYDVRLTKSECVFSIISVSHSVVVLREHIQKHAQLRCSIGQCHKFEFPQATLQFHVICAKQTSREKEDSINRITAMQCSLIYCTTNGPDLKQIKS